jgi:outer membrane protein TolC
VKTTSTDNARRGDSSFSDMLTERTVLNITISSVTRIFFAGILLGIPAALHARQQPDTPKPQPLVIPEPSQAQPGTPEPTTKTLRLTLENALALARKNDPVYHGAATATGIAGEDVALSRATLLPNVSYTTSYLYTQGNNSIFRVRYIANNAIHEYVSQGDIHQVLDAASFASYRKTAALAAVAKAQAEIAARGLVVTVVQDYFNVAAAEERLATAKRAAEEGDRFLQLTKDLEHGGEVAHADVIKAELQSQDRQRLLKEAQLALLNARLDLSVMLFPDFNDNFELGDNLHADVPLPTRAEFESEAAHNNPEIRAALATLQASNQEVNAARFGYFPTITLDYFYGIDAESYATYSVLPPEQGGRVPNLGSSALASLTIPLWNWGATQARVRQAELRRDQSKVELSFAQRKLLAEMRSLYSEAETASDELAGLQRSSELAAESLRLTTLRYKDGEATVLEVVDAQITFAAASDAYQNGALRYRVALANLQTLTGVLPNP